MTSLITDDADSRGLAGAGPAADDGADGPAVRRGPLHRGVPLPRAQLPEASTLLHRLSSMASLRAWEHRSTPALMHHAILRGAHARQAADAAHLSVAEAHVRWCAWAAEQLSAQCPEITAQQFLNVHAAFAAALAPEHR